MHWRWCIALGLLFLCLTVVRAEDAEEGSNEESAAGADAENLEVPIVDDDATALFDENSIPVDEFARGISIYARNGDSDGSGGIPVFMDTAVQLKWFKCDGLLNEDNSIECHVDDQFSDRITFDVYIDQPAHFIFFEPTVKANSDEAAPAIIDNITESDSSRTEFTVLYNCENLRTAADAETYREINLELSLPYTYRKGNISRAVTITYSWAHQCGEGPNKHAKVFVYDENAGGHVEEMVDGGDFVVDRSSGTSNMFLALSPPARIQGFGPIEIASSSASVTASVKPSQGLAMAREHHSFIIMYDCVREDVSKMTLTIPVPPFNPMSVSWVKNCTKPLLPNLDIVDPRSNMLFFDGRNGVKSPVVLFLSPEENFVDLKFASRDMHMPLVIHPLVVSTERPSILYAEVSSPGIEEALLTSFMDAAGGVLKHGEELTARLEFTCRSTGISFVFITVAVQEFQSIDFLVRKSCVAPPRRRGLLSTLAVFFFVLCLCTVLYSLRKYIPRAKMNLRARALKLRGR